jgi:hypothetical protein
MTGNIHKLGGITILQGEEGPFSGYTASRKWDVGRVIPFHVIGERIDINLGYIIFSCGERDIRVLEIQAEYDTFERLKHGLRLTMRPVPGEPRSLYIELKQAFSSNAFTKHETLHPTYSESDLDAGARMPVLGELRKIGAVVGTKEVVIGDTGRTAKHLSAHFPKDNLWVPVVAYIMTRILPMAWGYSG